MSPRKLVVDLKEVGAMERGLSPLNSEEIREIVHTYAKALCECVSGNLEQGAAKIQPD